jgi:hypothetical protein
VSRITLEASCDEHSISVCVTMTELCLSTPEGGVQYFMRQVMHHYRGETIRLKLTLFDGSIHAHYNFRATDQALQGIAAQWVKQIKDALL